MPLLGTAASDLQPTSIQGALCLLVDVWVSGHQLSSKYHPWSYPCPVGIIVEFRDTRESGPAKIPVRKQRLCLMCKQGAGTPLIYMCADRWTDLKYSLQIPLSPRKGASS